MDRDKLIALLKKHHTAFSAMLNVYNHLPFNNSIKGKVKLSTGVTMLKKCRIVSGGTDNEIIIGDLSTLERCEIYIYGSHNTIRLGDRVSCTQACFCIEGDHNRIEIGYHTTLFGEIQLAAIEGTKITIGEECIFSSKIELRTGDSHTVLRKGTMERINPSLSIGIGDHVWVGTKVTMLKGTQVPRDCVVGAGSLLCRAYEHPNCVIAGVPAKEVKQDIDWMRERI